MFRYAQLEMRIPTKCVKAKVDTKNPRLNLKSAQSVRHNSEILKKRLSKESTDVKREKSKPKAKLLLTDELKSEKNKEFLALIKEIKNEEQKVEIEGGSDSEGSEEDFSKDEAKNLISQILKRNNCKDYKKIRMRTKQNKIQFRKDENDNKEIL